MVMKICPKCATVNTTKAKFCPECGCNLITQDTHNENTINDNMQIISPNQRNFIHQKNLTSNSKGFNSNFSNSKTPWWKDLITALCLFIMPFTIIGIILMWVWNIPKSKSFRIVATILFSIICLYYFSSIGKSLTSAPTNIATSDIESDNSNISTSPDYSFQPIEIYNENNITVTLTEYAEKNGKPSFKMTIKNNSDINYQIYELFSAINNTMASADLDGYSIACGKELNTNINFTNDCLDKISPTEYDSFTFSMVLTDDNYQNEVDINPIEIKVRDNVIEKNEPTLFEDDSLRVTIISHSDDYKTVRIRIYNKSEDKITFNLANVSVNGSMFNGYLDICSQGYGGNLFSSNNDILSGYDAVTDITLQDNELNNIGISNITDLEGYIEIVKFGIITDDAENVHGPIQFVQ